MKKILVALSLVAWLGAPAVSEASYLSCGVAANAILYGTSQQQGLAIGHGAGVIDMLAALTCFVRGASCGCLDTLLATRSDQYADVLSEELATCAAATPDVSAVGPALRAAKRICG